MKVPRNDFVIWGRSFLRTFDIYR